MPQNELPLLRVTPSRQEPEVPESAVQAYLSQNLELLGLGQLQLVRIEHVLPTIGRVDILARSDDGTVHAIEVKKGIATRDAIGQLQSYVGALMANFPGSKIRGILVARDIDEPAKAALMATPTIDFWSYKIAFQFDKANIPRPRLPYKKVCPFCSQNSLAIWPDDGSVFCQKCGRFLSAPSAHPAL